VPQPVPQKAPPPTHARIAIMSAEHQAANRKAFGKGAMGGVLGAGSRLGSIGGRCIGGGRSSGMLRKRGRKAAAFTGAVQLFIW
jgi:hypothetical protein